MSDCIFCRIAQGEIPAQVVYEDPNLLAFRDVNPVAPVHILIIPRRHLTNLAAAGSADAPLLGELCLKAAEIARQEGIAETGWRLVANCGPDGGQSVDHLHLHLMGGRRLAWPPG